MTILVSPLSRVLSVVRTRAPERIVSVLEPGFMFPDFGSGYAGRYLRLSLHDVHMSTDGHVGPSAKHIAELLAFLDTWARTGPVLIHCRAGIGRSTAAAFIASCLFNPHADELELAQALRSASPSARPNESLVALADAAMNRGGRMNRAISETGRGLAWPTIDESVPFELPVEFEGRQREDRAEKIAAAPDWPRRFRCRGRRVLVPGG